MTANSLRPHRFRDDEGETSPSVADVAIPFQPGRVEAWMLQQAQDRGTPFVAVALTVPAIVASVLVTTAAVALFWGSDSEILLPGALLGAIVPALVAPPIIFLLIRFAFRIDDARMLLSLASTTDPLTGLLNRRGFFEQVEEMSPESGSYEVAMIDIDEFKEVNDGHGHATGDLVLKHVAEWLTECLGPAGLAARMGGDEFAIAAPLSDGPRLPSSQSLVIDGLSFSITIGRSEFTKFGDFEAALARADAQLYEGKSRLR